MRRYALVAALGVLLTACGEPLAEGATTSTVSGSPGALRPLKASPELLSGFDKQMYLLAQQIPGFGGLYLERDGATRILLVDGVLASQRAAASATASAWLAGSARRSTPTVLVGIAQYPISALLDWRVTARQLLSRPGVVGVGVDYARNQLRIEVLGPSEGSEARQVLVSLGIPVEAIEVEITEPPIPTATLTSKVRPILGGTRIQWRYGSATTSCTLGIPWTQNGVNGFLTASHCSDRVLSLDAEKYYQSTYSGDLIGTENKIGTTFTSVQNPSCPVGAVCKYADVAFATWSSASLKPSTADIALTTPVGVGGNSIGGQTIDRRLVIDSYSGAMPQEYLYKTGVSTGTTGGWTYDVCKDVTLQYTGNADAPTIVLLCQSEVIAGDYPGDSGAPVFSYYADASQPDGFYTSFRGIAYAARLCGTVPNTCERFIFTDVQDIQLQLP